MEQKISTEKWKLFDSEICGIFIIFESDKDVKTAQELINKTNVEIFGKKLQTERASEPSDYIWQNMIYSSSYQRTMKIVVYTFLLFVLVLGYQGQLYLQQSMTAGDKYMNMHCNLYEDSLADW